MAPRLLPAALAFLVLGAHFLRAGHLALVVVALAVVALFFVRRPWAARARSLLDAARRRRAAPFPTARPPCARP